VNAAAARPAAACRGAYASGAVAPEPHNSTPQSGAADRSGNERLDQLLEALGAATPTEHRARSLAPWAASIVIHVGLVLLGFAVTWTVVRLDDEEQPAMVVADFFASQYDPVTNLPAEPVPEPVRLGQAESQALQEMLTLRGADSPSADLLSQPADGALADFSPDSGAAAVTFVGLRSTNARRIVYVIDASGSMIRSLPIVVKELARSLDLLAAQQSFGIIFFQRNEALAVPPAGRLMPARSDERLKALAWIEKNVHPLGRSNPLKAIETAIALKPDVIFLLSENITGSGQFEIDQKDLLAMLEKLNPRDPATGARPTQINCVQFLDPDPLDTLRKIAEAHGGPGGGYRFLSRAELGLGTP
jgi:hypothetical protein